MRTFDQIPITRISEEKAEKRIDAVVTEVPLTVIVDDQEIATIICTPEFQHELAAGFLFSERRITGSGDIINLVHAPPPGDPYFNVWAAFWSGGTPDPNSMVTPNYRPRLLGTSPPEISWHLYQSYRDILTHTRHQLLDAIDMIYSGADRTSPRWKKTWNAMGKIMPQVLADYYHTCMCIAYARSLLRSSPMLATHSLTSRAYCRVVNPRDESIRPANSSCPGFRLVSLR